MPETSDPHPCAFCATPTRYEDAIRKAHICLNCLARLSASPPCTCPSLYPWLPPGTWSTWPVIINTNGGVLT